MIGKTIREYRFLSEIGKGGMGTVYLAEHTGLGIQRAIKCLAPELTRDSLFRKRFHNEAIAQAALVHPNIVQVIEFFVEDGESYLVMEYIDGPSLDDILHRRTQLSPGDCFHILKGLLKGLGFAHKNNVIHRDVKPANILLNTAGEAKITDFGIALKTGAARLTKVGTKVGTSEYMSPEQIRSSKNLDYRSDVYSLGIILYEMLAGSLPFEGENEYDIQKQHINDPPPKMAAANDITTGIENLVMRALEKKPDNRYLGCGNFIEYIKDYEETFGKFPDPDPKLFTLHHATVDPHVPCERCVAAGEKGHRFCTNCGIPTTIHEDPSVKCEKCGNELYQNGEVYKFCNICATPSGSTLIMPAKCEDCGEDLPPDSLSCPSCEEDSRDLIVIKLPEQNKRFKRINPKLFTLPMWVGLGLIVMVFNLGVDLDWPSELQLTLFFTGVFGIFFALVYHLVSLYRCWNIIQEHTTTTGPKQAILLLLVPIINFFWCIVAVKGLAADVNKRVKWEHTARTRINEPLSVVYCLVFFVAIAWSYLIELPYPLILFAIIANLLTSQWAKFNNAFLKELQS